LADPARVRRILEDAGFEGVAIEPHRTTMLLGSIAEAVDFLTQVGPAARSVAEAEPQTRPLLLDALRSALATYDSASGVVLQGAIWLVSARA
jgi:hypothetical protein